MALTPTEVADELRGELGEEGVRVPGDEDLSRYLDPWRGPPGATTAVVRPSDVDQVRSVVRWARRRRIRLIPQGANTGLVGGSTPPPTAASGASAADLASGCVVLTLERLRGAPTIDPVDRTAVCDAGLRLSELNEAAAEHGLSLPIDLGADPTLGGMVSTNTGGARMLRYGDVRRNLLGLELVIADADASVVDELSTLRKHNVGPSITRLAVGAAGAVGVVTRVAVELTPIPDERASAWILPSSDEGIAAALVALERRHPTELSAFEVLNPVAMDAGIEVSGSNDPPSDRDRRRVAFVELSGVAGVEDRLVDSLARLHESDRLVDAVVVPSVDTWQLRHGVTEGLARRGTVLGHDVAVDRSVLPELLDAVEDELRRAAPDAVLADFGHWGDGGVHCNVVVDPLEAAELRAPVRDLVLGTVVDRFGGSFSAEHGIGSHNAGWWRRATPGAVRTAMAAAVETFDPLGVLGHPDLPFRDG